MRLHRVRLLCVLCAAFALLTSIAQADARTDFLVRLLRTSDQFRVRAQAALALGRVQNDPNVTRALVEALRDENAAVRAASASALETVGDPSALDGLRAIRNDRDRAVQSAVARTIRALERIAPPPAATGVATTGTGTPRFYIGVGVPGAQAALSADVITRARTFLTTSVSQMAGVSVAPDRETPAAARGVITQRRLTGCYLETSINSVEVRPDGGVRAAVSVTVFTYPGRELRSMLTGAATVQGAGSGDAVREQAVQSAITSALRRLPQALEAAAASAAAGNPI